MAFFNEDRVRKLTELQHSVAALRTQVDSLYRWRRVELPSERTPRQNSGADCVFCGALMNGGVAVLVTENVLLMACTDDEGRQRCGIRVEPTESELRDVVPAMLRQLAEVSVSLTWVLAAPSRVRRRHAV